MLSGYSIVLGEGTYGVTPKIQFKYEGSEVSMECVSHTVVQWIKGGQRINVKVGKNKLYISDAARSDSGIYECHGTKINNLGQLEDFVEETTVIVGGISIKIITL